MRSKVLQNTPRVLYSSSFFAFDSLLVMDNSVRAARNLLENALSMMNQQETNPRKLVHRIACVFVNNKWRACVFVK